MSYSIGEDIIGKVESVKPYALFLCFEDGSKGLLHISEISDSYIRDIERFGYVGDELKVRVLSIDKHNGFLRVSLKAIPENERYSTHKHSVLEVPVLKEGDFDPIKEKLPEWMANTLKKIEEEEK